MTQSLASFNHGDVSGGDNSAGRTSDEIERLLDLGSISELA